MNIVARYKKVRAYTMELCEPLFLEDYIPQGSVFASPVKWHIAHTTWFFETFLLKNYLKNYKEFHSDFNFLFNSYYNAIGTRTARINRGVMSRPSVEDVHKYRAHVDNAMMLLFDKVALDLIFPLLEIGINHEQQHQELLLTDLKYNFSLNPIHPLYKEGASLVSNENTDAGFVSVSAGVYKVGYEGGGFSFDNEHSRHDVFLRDCIISKSLVTNGEFLQFIHDDGYKRHELWLDEGWSWINQEGIENPLYWKKANGKWFQFSLEGLIPLNEKAQLAHISHYEAAAFSEWKGMRLPTEFEWEVASESFNWGARWEHTSSAYLAYPGYKKPSGAVGEYNGKFMMNQMVLRGASNATPKGHSRRTYRNFFHPNMQWQFAGIRLASDE